MATVQDLAQGIARFEGFNVSGSVAQRNNNPGNLRSWGSYPVVNGYVQFPDAATGWAALESQVQTNINRGLTLDEFFGGKPGVYGGYAPSADSNNPTHYAATVAGWLGISPTVPLSTAMSGGAPSSPASDSGSDGSIDLSSSFDLSSVLPSSSSSLGLVAGVVAIVAAGWMLFRD